MIYYFNIMTFQNVSNKTVSSLPISFLHIEIQSLSYSDFCIGGVDNLTKEIYHFWMARFNLCRERFICVFLFDYKSKQKL